MTAKVEPVVVRKQVRVPREFAFRYWCEPLRLAIWLSAEGESARVESFDFRPEGGYRIALDCPGGDYGFEGVFRTIEPPSLISLTWRRFGKDADPAETQVTVRLREIPGGTEIEVRHDELPDEKAAELAFRDWTDRIGRWAHSSRMDHLMEEMTMTTTMEATGWAGKIAAEKAALDRAMNRLYDTFAHVPEDRLNGQLSPTTKSPLRLAAHVAASNQHFVAALLGDPSEPTEFADVFAKIDAAEQTLTTREAVLNALGDSHLAVQAAYDQLNVQEVEANPRLQFYVTLPAYHVVNHAAQIDYIQTSWGDLENHFGM